MDSYQLSDRIEDERRQQQQLQQQSSSSSIFPSKSSKSSSSSSKPSGHQPSRDDAIIAVAKVIHRHIIHGRDEQDARDRSTKTPSSTRNGNGSRWSNTFGTPILPGVGRSVTFDVSPSLQCTPSSGLNSPAIGSPYSSLSTPPTMAIDLDDPHKFDTDIFDIDHYLARSYAVQVPLMARLTPFSAYEQKRQYHFVPVPTVEHVHKFIKRIFDQARLNAG